MRAAILAAALIPTMASTATADEVCVGSFCADVDLTKLSAQAAPAPVAQPQRSWWGRHGFGVAFSFSLGCEAADLATTMYYVGKGTVYEGNPVLAPWQDQPLQFTAVKMGIAGAGHVAAWQINRMGHPYWAQAMMFANGAVKCYVATRNDYLGRPRAVGD